MELLMRIVSFMNESILNYFIVWMVFTIIIFTVSVLVNDFIKGVGYFSIYRNKSALNLATKLKTCDLINILISIILNSYSNDENNTFYGCMFVVPINSFYMIEYCKGKYFSIVDGKDNILVFYFNLEDKSKNEFLVYNPYKISKYKKVKKFIKFLSDNLIFVNKLDEKFEFKSFEKFNLYGEWFGGQEEFDKVMKSESSFIEIFNKII